MYQIGKLCQNLRWLYQGEQKARKREYDGKVKFNDLNRFEKVDGFDGFHTAIVNSSHFKRNLRII